MAKRILEIAAEIVQAQVSSHQHLSTDEIVGGLRQVFNLLRELQREEAEGAPLESLQPDEVVEVEDKAVTEMSARDSIQEDRVICLECSAEMRQLTAKHLSSHQMSIKEYKRKWGIPLRQSLSAKSLSRARSEAAKERGLPERLRSYHQERRKNKELAAESDLPKESGMDVVDAKKTKGASRRLKMEAS